MDTQQLTIYNNLMALTEKSECFYFSDQILASKHYRIFLYRLSSYSEWLEPDALESRGITFLLSDMCEPMDLVSRPFPKFFNYQEVTDDINTLASCLIANGDLSQDVYDKFKNKNKGKMV